jgi:hypothetical protein
MRAAPKINVVVFLFVVSFAVSAFGSAAKIYITQTGSATGNCTTSVQTPAFFNNAANWGAGANQIGPGTVVLLCGTFTSSVNGGNMLTVQGSGTSGNPVVINCDTTCTFNSTGWWGSYNNDLCTTCTGAITINNVNYITLDGKGTGVIENMLAGCVQGGGTTCDGNVSARCLSGACTQVPTTGTIGIHIYGDHIVVRNWTVQKIYVNAGSTSDAQNNDTGGVASVGIRLDGCASGTCNIEIANNTISDARRGIGGSASGSTGAASCPGAGVCYHDNKISGGSWPMLLNESAASGVVNVYNNEIGDIGSLYGWKYWQYPDSAYHQSGIFIAGTNSNLTAYVWNNYIHGDLGQGSPSGLLYCTAWGANTVGGCIMTAWNNIIVGTGSALTKDQALGSNEPSLGATQKSNVTAYNNTIVGTAYSYEVYTGNNSGSMQPSFHNNIFAGSGLTWNYNASNGGTYLSSWSADNNDYHNSTTNRWQYNSDADSTLATWQAASGGDANAVTGDPKLDANYKPQSGSAAIGLGENLTRLCTGDLVSLCMDKAGTSRPSSGAWDAGAYQYAPSVSPTQPNGLNGTLQPR